MLQEGAIKDAAKPLDDAVIQDTPMKRSPIFFSPVDYSNQNNLLRTPKTPQFEDCYSNSRLEALSMDLLVFLRSLELLYVLVLSLFAIMIIFLLEDIFSFFMHV